MQGPGWMDLGPGGLGQAGGGQGGPAAGRAAGLKGVRGLQSRHSYCPLVTGVTGQQGSQEGCLASGNSHCSCCGNRGQIPPCSHPVRRFRMVGGLCTLMGFYLSPLHRDGGGQSGSWGKEEWESFLSFPHLALLAPAPLGDGVERGSSEVNGTDTSHVLPAVAFRLQVWGSFLQVFSHSRSCSFISGPTPSRLPFSFCRMSPFPGGAGGPEGRARAHTPWRGDLESSRGGGPRLADSCREC